IYPVIFLISSFVFYRDSKKLSLPKWLVFLSIFSLYALVSFLIFYNGTSYMLTNMVKLFVNFVFFYFAVNWLGQRDNGQLLKWVDLVFHFVFLLVLAQLLVYHHALYFR